MRTFFREIEHKGFYLCFFYLICLYAIFLRLQFVPSSLTYFLYGISILYSIKILLRRGLLGLKGKIDVVFIFLFLLYYFFSGLIYVSLDQTGSSSSWIFKDFLYSLLPIFFYLIIRLSKIKLDTQVLLLITWLAILIVDFISLVLLFSPNSSISGYFKEELLEFEGTINFALSGLNGVILTGFVNIIGFIICLFSPIKLNKIIKISSALLFVVCAFLTGQRTPIAGFLLIIVIYLLQKKSKGAFAILAIVGVFMLALPYIDYEVEGVPVKEAMTERILYRFSNVKGGDTGRNEQYQIYNDDNILELIVGDGVGKHSPENEKSVNAMPDAMLFRIFNEMGIIGLMLFLLFFYVNFIRSVKNRNWFAISLIVFSFFANSFNRVLFTAPLSILPYVLISYFNWKVEEERVYLVTKVK